MTDHRKTELKALYGVLHGLTEAWEASKAWAGKIYNDPNLDKDGLAYTTP